MLRVARAKLTKETEGVKKRIILKRGDMRNFALNQSFPLIYVPASTFDHNITIEDQKRTLDCIYKHLEKNGRFAFDLEQATPDKPEASWWIDRKEIDEQKMVVRSIFTKRDKTKHICNLNLFFDLYDNGTLLKRFNEYGEVAIISKDKIVKLLEENKFEIENVYGDFDQTEYREDSSRIVLVAKKE